MTVQSLFESNSCHLESMDKLKHNKPSRHKEELQSNCVHEEMCTLVLIVEKLWAMPKDWKKKLQFNKIYCENATWHEADDMFQEFSKRKPVFRYKPVETLSIGIYFIAFFLD